MQWQSVHRRIDIQALRKKSLSITFAQSGHQYVRTCEKRAKISSDADRFFSTSVYRGASYSIASSPYIWMNINIFNNFVFYLASYLRRACCFQQSSQYVKYYFGVGPISFVPLRLIRLEQQVIQFCLSPLRFSRCV